MILQKSRSVYAASKQQCIAAGQEVEVPQVFISDGR